MSKKLLTLLMMMLLVPMFSACGDDGLKIGDYCSRDSDTPVCDDGGLFACDERGHWQKYECFTGAYCMTFYDKTDCYYACSESNQECPNGGACTKTKKGYFCL